MKSIRIKNLHNIWRESTHSSATGDLRKTRQVYQIAMLLQQLNERYQYPRASPGLRRRCLLFRPKGRGISPCFPGTRSGEEPSC
jgi:hypothetical protein